MKGGHYMTLLILEDSVDIRDTIKETVQLKGNFNQIYTATTIEEATTISEEEDVTIFIVDIKLPDGSGYDFIKHIRSIDQYKYAWVVIITGQEESVDDVLDAVNTRKCQRYIKKPFTMAYLLEILAELQKTKVVESPNAGKLKIKRKSIDYFF